MFLRQKKKSTQISEGKSVSLSKYLKSSITVFDSNYTWLSEPSDVIGPRKAPSSAKKGIEETGLRGNQYGSQLAGDKTSNCDSLHAQETLARLINAMASVKTGRDYICKLFTWKLGTREVATNQMIGGPDM